MNCADESSDKADAQNSEPIKKRKSGNPDKIAPFQFKPGQSGNPGGRPKKKPITDLYAEILNDPQVVAKIRDSVVKVIVGGRMGGVLQLKEMAERVEGKVSQTLEVNGELALTLSDRIKKARERAGS